MEPTNITYRAKGIPEALDKAGATELLNKTLGSHSVRIGSLAADDNDGTTDQVATFHFTDKTAMPPKKAAEADDDWYFFIDDGPGMIVIDKRFLGFTPLYSPVEAEHIAE